MLLFFVVLVLALHPRRRVFRIPANIVLCWPDPAERISNPGALCGPSLAYTQLTKKWRWWAVAVAVVWRSGVVVIAVVVVAAAAAAVVVVVVAKRLFSDEVRICHLLPCTNVFAELSIQLRGYALAPQFTLLRFVAVVLPQC